MSDLFRMPIDALVSVAVAASREETRYYLRGVHIRVVKGGYVLEASDGHIGAMQFVAMDTALPSWAHGKIIHEDKIAAAAKAIPRRAPEEMRAVSLDEAGTLRTLSDTLALPHSLIDGTFPDLSRVFRGALDKEGQIPEATHLVGVNADLLARLQKSAGTAAISLHGTGQGEPHLVQCSDPMWCGVIMPFRVIWDWKTPDWL